MAIGAAPDFGRWAADGGKRLRSDRQIRDLTHPIIAATIAAVSSATEVPTERLVLDRTRIDGRGETAVSPNGRPAHVLNAQFSSLEC